jgi:protein TonB
MFENLVESTSHKEDFARKGSFIMGTLIVYAVLGIAFFVAGIYWYDAHLENQNLELTTLVAPVPVQADAPQPKQEAPKAQKVSDVREVSTVREVTTDRPEQITQGVKSTATNSPPIRGAVIGDKDRFVASAPSMLGEGSGNGASVGPPPPPPSSDEPPPPKPSPTPKPVPKAPVSGGVLNGKAVNLPKPSYPPIARTAHASGTVVVQVTIDETGKVISAHAISGHPLLQAAAVQAAYSARFSPTQLSGQPVKVTGTINYNFQL